MNDRLAHATILLLGYIAASSGYGRWWEDNNSQRIPLIVISVFWLLWVLYEAHAGWG